MEVVAVWYVLLFGWLFVMGCAVGSFLNVCVYRLPRGKSLLWPSSRCGSCFAPIPLYLNVPLVSYLLLRGRCARCGARYSFRYFAAEFLTGAAFALLYFLEVGLNVQNYWPRDGFDSLVAANFPPHSWPLFAAHGALLSLLMVSAVCLLDGEGLPGGLTVTGGLLGVGWSLLYPDFVLWPVWRPLPVGGVTLGALTGAAGLLTVPWLVRLVGWLHWRFGGRDAFGPAAGLLAMTGGFLGWQPLLVAVALACVVAPLAAMVRARSPFSLALVSCLTATWLGWGWLGPSLESVLFDPWLAPLAVAVVAGLLWVTGFVVGQRRLSSSR